VKIALASAAAVALVCTAARGDVVDLSGGARRRAFGGSGLTIRADFGNAFAPYGYAGGGYPYGADPYYDSGYAPAPAGSPVPDTTSAPANPARSAT